MARQAPDTKPLPWFAEDLTPEDLALVLSTSGATESELEKRDLPREQVEQLKQNAVQWEGYLDEATKRRIVLGENDADFTPEKKELGHYIGIDCEMVGVGPGARGSALARVTLVNWHGFVVYDKFVRPQEKVTDYRTWVSGVRPADLRKAPTFAVVQQEVADLIKDRVLVGHAIENDLRALMLSHPRPQIRDTAQFAPLRELSGRKHPGLRTLAKLVLGIEIQKKGHAHSPVEDARATMAIFRTQKTAWDKALGVHTSSKLRKRTSVEMAVETSVAEEAHGGGATVVRTKTSRIARAPAPPVPQLSGAAATREKPRRDTARVKAAPEWWLND